jgi:hypothetical protein
MDWNAIGALSQIFATGAVVVSLLYLARQMKQSTATARAAAYQSFVEQQGALTMAFLTNSRLTDVFTRAVVKRASLSEFSEVDRTAVIMLCALQARIYEVMFRQVREGVLDDSALHLVAGISFLNSPAWTEVWPMVSPALTPEFVAYFNEQHSVLLNSRATPTPAGNSPTPRPS